MIRVGLVGCGWVSEAHMTVYSLLPEAQVAGVADVVPEKARAVARRFNVEKTFPHHQGLFASEELDLVDICTPTPTHAEI
ncbi:MAG: Gfo/Idh/MocA family protein, partial [Thermoplasmata archaeon]